jgi:hypothetical protein
VVIDASERFKHEIQSSAIALDVLGEDDAKDVMLEWLSREPAQDLLAEMTEWCVTDIMSRRNRLAKRHVETEFIGN